MRIESSFYLHLPISEAHAFPTGHTDHRIRNSFSFFYVPMPIANCTQSSFLPCCCCCYFYWLISWAIVLYLCTVPHPSPPTPPIFANFIYVLF
jgi:hypothetical protein